MKEGDTIKYKTSKNSLKIFYGIILGFKEDKIHVSKYRFSDYSGYSLPNTYIDLKDIEL